LFLIPPQYLVWFLNIIVFEWILPILPLKLNRGKTSFQLLDFEIPVPNISSMALNHHTSPCVTCEITFDLSCHLTTLVTMSPSRMLKATKPKPRNNSGLPPNKVCKDKAKFCH